MNRAFLLIVLAAVIAAALTLMALDGAPEQFPAEEDVATSRELPPEVEVPAETETALAAVAKEREFDPVTTEGPTRSWEVVVLNELGQPLPEARILASRTGQALEGTGRERWETVASGPWSLVVELEGFPTWRRDLVLESNKRIRTVARLGEELRISGTIQDEFGEPANGLPVFFLPPGVGHPSSRDLVRDPKNPRSVAQPRNGAISAELLAGGRVKAKLPQAGEWRVSVGRPGDAQWTERTGQVLTYGGQEQVEVTIPALGQVRFEFPQEGPERPRQVSAHIYDAEHAAGVLRTRMQGGSDDQEAGSADKATEDNASSEELNQQLKAKSAEKERQRALGTAKPIKIEMSNSVNEVREMAGKAPARAPAFQPGWRMVKSARPDVNGVAELKGLPLRTQIRFLFVRGKEQITTSAAIQLRDGNPRLGVPSLPLAGTTPPSGPDNRATVALKPVPVASSQVREPGVRWTF